MTNSKHIPKRRFPGFEGEWVDFEFKSLLDSYEGIRRGPFGSALKKEFFVPTSEYVVYEQNNAIYNTWDTRYYISYEKFQELEKFKVLPGDFLLSGAGTIGKISQVPKGVKQGVFNQALIRLRINKSFVDENFFLIWIQSDRMQEKLTDANPGSAMTNLVPMSELKKWIVSIPKKEEQVRISHFIFKINTLITLHQHKLDKLKNLKKSYLAELFPAEGERVPKRRFSGFEGEWEEKKLGDVGKTFTGLSGKTKVDFGHGNGMYVTYLNIYSNEIADLRGLDKIEIDDRQTEVKYGDVFFTTSSETPEEVGLSSVWKYDLSNVYLNSFCFGFRPNVTFDIDFLAYLLRSPAFRAGMKLLAQGISRYNISKNRVLELNVLFPTLKEQEKIGKQLSLLDKSISLQQQKLDKLKDLKKAYLNELFV